MNKVSQPSPWFDSAMDTGVIPSHASQPAPGTERVNFDDLMTYPSPHGTLVRLADVKCRVWAAERAPSGESIDTPEFRTVLFAYVAAVNSGDIERANTAGKALISYIDALRATAGNAAPTDLRIEVRSRRIFIINGVQSFMLDYAADEGDDPAEIEFVANRLREALSIFTPCVKQEIHGHSAGNAAAPGELTKKRIEEIFGPYALSICPSERKRIVSEVLASAAGAAPAVDKLGLIGYAHTMAVGKFLSDGKAADVYMEPRSDYPNGPKDGDWMHPVYIGNPFPAAPSNTSPVDAKEKEHG